MSPCLSKVAGIRGQIAIRHWSPGVLDHDRPRLSSWLSPMAGDPLSCCRQTCCLQMGPSLRFPPPEKTPCPPPLLVSSRHHSFHHKCFKLDLPFIPSPLVNKARIPVLLFSNLDIQLLTLRDAFISRSLASVPWLKSRVCAGRGLSACTHARKTSRRTAQRGLFDWAQHGPAVRLYINWCF